MLQMNQESRSPHQQIEDLQRILKVCESSLEIKDQLIQHLTHRISYLESDKPARIFNRTNNIIPINFRKITR